MGDQAPANPDDLRSAARDFSSGAQQVRDQFHGVMNIISDLLSGADAWAGSGSQQFQAAWNRASRDASVAADALDHTAQVLNKFAADIEQVQSSQEWGIVAGIGMGLLTVGMVVVDALQAGLDPATDAATVVTAGAADAAFTAVGEGFAAAEEAAVTGLDAAAEMTPEVESVLGDTGAIADEGGGVVDLPPEETPPTAPGDVPPPETPVDELPPEETPPGATGDTPPPEEPPGEVPPEESPPESPEEPPTKTTYGPKIEKQMVKRGWTPESIDDTIEHPDRIVETRDTRFNLDGTRNDDPATAYINSDGSYVVRNDRTGDIVQVSDRNDPDWKPPF
jgi:WXG100 family type VII secretion target